MCEPELGDSCWVAVWSTKYKFHLEILQTTSCVSTTMITRSIHDYYSLVSPFIPEVICETWRKLRQEQLHDILVSITLRLRKVDLALRGNCNDKIDLVPHHLVWQRWVLVSGLPASPPKVSLRDPTLIDVDDVVAFAVYLHHLPGVQLPQDKASFRVARPWYSL